MTLQSTGSGPTGPAPTATTIEDVAARVMGHLARRYIEAGWQRSGVTPNSLLDRDYGPAFHPALAFLAEKQAVYISVQDMTLLTPLLRLDLVGEDTLAGWQASMRAATVLEREDFVHAVRTELHALTAFAFALGDALPADMDARCSALAAVLAVRGFDLDALKVIRRYGGPQHTLFRHLIRHPGQAWDTSELHELVVEVARMRQAPREQLPLPSLSDVIWTAGQSGQPPAWEPRNAWASNQRAQAAAGAGAGPIPAQPAPRPPVADGPRCRRCGRPTCHH